MFCSKDQSSSWRYFRTCRKGGARAAEEVKAQTGHRRGCSLATRERGEGERWGRVTHLVIGVFAWPVRVGVRERREGEGVVDLAVVGGRRACLVGMC